MVDRLLLDGNVYCVRYLIDTVAYHRALGVPVELEYKAAHYEITRPDLTIFLQIQDERIRQQRIAARGSRSIGDRLMDNGRLRAAVIRAYWRLQDHFSVVDNCGEGISEVVDTIRMQMAVTASRVELPSG